MYRSKLLEVADEAIWNVIREELGEDPQNLEKQVELFEDWLKREPSLPNDVDQHIIRNFVRHCHCDLEKAQRKFEQFIMSRTKLKTYFTNRDLNDEYFDDILLHRQLIPVPKFTPEGYRIIYARVLPDINHFDVERLLHYSFVYIDYVLCEDSAAGYIGVYDLQYFKIEHLDKANTGVLAEALNFIYNIEVCNIKSLHFLNVPEIPETILAMVRQLIKTEIINKTFVHKNPAELIQHLSEGIVPKEYGGTGVNFDEFAETAKKYFIDNKDLYRKTANLELQGSILESKPDLDDSVLSIAI